MSDTLNLVYDSIDKANADKPASTRRQFVTGAAATLGSLGFLSLADDATAQEGDSVKHILDVAATAEVLATIVNTIGHVRGLGRDRVTRRNIKSAAREELVHYRVLRSLGGEALATRIWVPDAVFANRSNFLNTVAVGDQIFINAYLIATKRFGNLGNGKFAAVASEFMGVEAVHRALARQSLGQLGNDRVFIKFAQKERAPGAANRGQPGFTDIDGAVRQAMAAGFGFGRRGARPGQFYDFFKVNQRTPTDPDLNTFRPQG